ncbi:MAG TPA: serine hydrolase [Puia sp.]|nr:serine hydrolase [Puia sp.]
MRRILTPVLCFLVVSSFAQKSSTDNRFAGFDTAFAHVLKDWHAAGFAVAIVEKNKIIYAKGFGYRDIESKSPVTSNTLFAIGSCTKAFTASLLGMLRRDDKVDFDKPVRNYLPDLKFYNDEMNDKISLRDMMCHRTGLPRHDFSWYYFRTPSRDSLIHRIQYMEPSAGLREKWQYNNFMFLAQGVVVEKLTGKSWEENIREKIFQPLGMTHSVLSIEDMIKSGDAAIGYELKNDTLIKKTDYYHIDAMGPAGSINSCVNDMGNWVITWINGGKFNGREIIPAAFESEAISSQMIAAPALPDKDKKDLYFANYGFGWGLSSYKGHYRVEHGGNIDGFSASTCLFPSDSIGIVVLVNQGGSYIPAIVRNLVADRMLGLKYFDWNSDLKKTADNARKTAKEREKSAVSNRVAYTKPSHDLKDYTGLYNNKGYGTFEVSFVHDSLFVFIGTHIWWLRHYHYDWFEPFEKDPRDGIDTSDKSEPIQFQTNKAGEIESASVAFEPTLKPIVFSKTPKAKEISKDSLQKFVGEYELSSVVIKVYIKGEKTLCMLVPGQPEYELVPVDKNKFSIKSLNGYTVQFNANDKNEITELLSIQPNGTFKIPRKK